MQDSEDMIYKRNIHSLFQSLVCVRPLLAAIAYMLFIRDLWVWFYRIVYFELE